MYVKRCGRLRILFTRIVPLTSPSSDVPTLVMSRPESASMSGNYTSKAFDEEALWTVVRKSVVSFPCVEMTLVFFEVKFMTLRLIFKRYIEY